MSLETPEPPEPPAPGSIFLGVLLMGTGALLALVTGTCVMSDQRFDAVSFVPAGIGAVLGWMGWQMIRPGKPSKGRPPPLPPRRGPS